MLLKKQLRRVPLLSASSQLSLHSAVFIRFEIWKARRRGQQHPATPGVHGTHGELPFIEERPEGETADQAI